MKISDSIYLVGSGKVGFYLTNRLDCNVYLVDTGDGCVLIDAGANVEPDLIEDVICSHGFQLNDIKKILLTHYHTDHSAGVNFFSKHCNCEIFAPAKEVSALHEADEVASGLAIERVVYNYADDYKLEPIKAKPLQDGEVIKQGNIAFVGYTIPGHSLEDMVYCANIDGKNCMFSGDAVLAQGQIILQPFPDCSIYPYAQAMKKISKLPVDALFPGHGIFILNSGIDSIQAAVDKFESISVPEQLFYI